MSTALLMRRLYGFVWINQLMFRECYMLAYWLTNQCVKIWGKSWYTCTCLIICQWQSLPSFHTKTRTNWGTSQRIYAGGFCYVFWDLGTADFTDILQWGYFVLANILNTGNPLLKSRRELTQITKFMGPTWGPPGFCRPQMGHMLAPWTLL